MTGGPGTESGDAVPTPPRRRPRVVLWSSLAAGTFVAVLVAVFAASSTGGQLDKGSPLVGRAAPPISGAALVGGRRVTLSQFRGRWVLVNFSASWCIPCRQETPQLQAFSRGHAGAGDAVVLGVAYDDSDVGDLRAFLESVHAAWPVVNDGQAVVAYGIDGIPESYLVDPEGRVAAEYLGGITEANLDEFIQRSGGPS